MATRLPLQGYMRAFLATPTDRSALLLSRGQTREIDASVCAGQSRKRRVPPLSRAGSVADALHQPRPSAATTRRRRDTPKVVRGMCYTTREQRRARTNDVLVLAVGPGSFALACVLDPSRSSSSNH